MTMQKRSLADTLLIVAAVCATLAGICFLVVQNWWQVAVCALGAVAFVAVARQLRRDRRRVDP
jgi:membrane protein implicated in regulation of membrane protease activity